MSYGMGQCSICGATFTGDPSFVHMCVPRIPARPHRAASVGTAIAEEEGMERFEELLDACVNERCRNYFSGTHDNAANYALVEYVDGLRRQRDERTSERDAANKRADDLHEKNKEAIVALVAHSENETRLLNASIQAYEERDAARRELCMYAAEMKRRMPGVIAWRTRDEVEGRGWSYLYETPPTGR